MAPHQGDSWLEKIDRGLARVEGVLVVVVLSVMIGLASVNLVLHKFFSGGFDWADIVVRQMVLWLGFLGGALATHEGRHIAIDAVGKLMKPTLAAATRVLTSAAALVLTGAMFFASIDFIKAEIEDGSELTADLPAWPFEVVIPAALFLIAFHFLVAVYTNTLVALGKREPPPEFDELDHPHEFPDADVDGPANQADESDGHAEAETGDDSSADAKTGGDA